MEANAHAVENSYIQSSFDAADAQSFMKSQLILEDSADEEDGDD
jgi:hypothetical protein